MKLQSSSQAVRSSLSSTTPPITTKPSSAKCLIHSAVCSTAKRWGSMTRVMGILGSGTWAASNLWMSPWTLRIAGSNTAKRSTCWRISSTPAVELSKPYFGRILLCAVRAFSMWSVPFVVLCRISWYSRWKPGSAYAARSSASILVPLRRVILRKGKGSSKRHDAGLPGSTMLLVVSQASPAMTSSALLRVSSEYLASPSSRTLSSSSRYPR
mmetsp:Transcript_50565/g.130287  ORF Transcript_50565/g.130287 Transcript_50565/m.130287 type:complete len:212 (-) Transcript_50565:543-1178(-)